MRAIAVLLNAGNAVAKDGFVAAFDLAVDQLASQRGRLT
jgi:hypothetical protein